LIKFIHLNYHYHKEFSTPEEVIGKHKLSSGFVNYIKRQVNFISVKHLNYNGERIVDGVSYFFFRSRNRFWYIPFKTHRFIEKESPEIILIEGFVFPIQVMALRLSLGRKCKIIAQHHGEKPFRGIKRFIQGIANRSIDAFIFTSLGNAKEWIDKKVINKNKCYEVLSASTDIIPLHRQESKGKLAMLGNDNFLWVGRLNANKDPLTVLAAFEKYSIKIPSAKLYMIYQTEELLPEIKRRISKSETLNHSVILVGKKDHNELADWYSAADFFISGSHSEGSGYALVEAMTCGCIPVVTNIPSFNKITGEGKYGILYEAGNTEDLYQKLLQLKALSGENYSTAVLHHSKEQLSYKAIADQLYRLCLQLLGK
jgi:Glycosyltransferase